MLENINNAIALLHQPAVLYPVVLFVGLMVGSFLNVVIYRLPQMMERSWYQQCSDYFANTQDPDAPALPESNSPHFNLWWPGSHCPQCKTNIRPWENIPIISFLFLRGRCAKCRTRISIRYPLVEALTALLSLFLAINYGFGPELFGSLILTWLLIALTFIDFDTQLLPDDLTYLGLWLGLLLSLYGVFIAPADAIIGAIVGYMVLWTLYWGFKFITRKEGMGYGDFKLMALAGAWVGWKYLPLVLLIASLTGIIWALSQICLRKAHKDDPLPFGPFIAIGTWLTLVFGKYWVF